MVYARMIGSGSYVPLRILTNGDLEKVVDTTDDWITTRTGIKERHIAEDKETNATMGTLALANAIQDAGISPADLDLIIVGTNTNRVNFPSCAAEIQSAIKEKYEKTIPFFDIQAGCTAGIYGIAAADAFIRSNQYKTIALVGTDKLSEITDYTDRNSCVLFGDLAASLILQQADSPGIIKSYLGGYGTLRKSLVMDPNSRKLVMKGREIYRFTQDVIVEACQEVVKDTKDPSYGLADINWVVPHQANERINEAAAERLGMQGRFISTIEMFGNTSTASYFHAFDLAKKEGKIKKGDLVIFVGFGAGLTWGANLIRV